MMAIKFLFIGALLVSSALGAPWVVLDSRNDMLAMSSEVSEQIIETTTGVASESVTDKPADDEPATTANVENILDNTSPVSDDPAIMEADQGETTTVASNLLDEEQEQADDVETTTTAIKDETPVEEVKPPLPPVPLPPTKPVIIERIEKEVSMRVEKLANAGKKAHDKFRKKAQGIIF